MLAKQFLDFRRRGDYLKPCFVSAEDASALAEAGVLLDLFNRAVAEHFSRDELEEEIRLFVGGTDRKFGGALAAILLKRTRFLGADSVDYPAVRAELFTRAARELGGTHATLEEYQRAVPSQVADIYGDLPGCEQVDGVEAISPAELILRYNLELAQGILRFADTLEFTFFDPEPRRLRRVLGYLKFCRLLAEAKPQGSALKVAVSGPLTLIEQNRKYAVELAGFFAAAITVEKWKMSALITPEGAVKPYKLVLEASPLLRSHIRGMAGYVPEEIRMFFEQFRSKANGFDIADEPGVVVLPRGTLAVADAVFISQKSGRKYYLELLHRHHARVLADRLAATVTPEDGVWLLGIDRAVAPAGGEAQLPENAFLFRDFPGVARVLTLLNRLDG